MNPPLVFIAHPVSGEVAANLETTARWVRWAIVEHGVYAIAPYIGLCAALNDGDIDERARGMDISLEVLKRCDALWLCGLHLTAGMKIERDFASSLDIPIVRFTANLPPCTSTQEPT